MDHDGGRTGDGTMASGAMAVLAEWRSLLARLDRDVPDTERVDLLRGLEELKSAAAAAQAQLAVDLDASQRAAQAAAGMPARERGKGVGAQVALARRESPHRGGRLLGLAQALVREMPHTLRALQQGLVSEWRATLLVRESACLSVADRAAFDAELAGSPAGLASLGDKQLVARAKQVAYRLDPASVARRASQAESDRRVTIRPAPETMTYLTGLLPVAQGVGVYAALKRAADSLRAQGDARSRGQIMADTLVERVTGQAAAADVPVEVQLVITDRALLAGQDEPAHVAGYGVVPATWARELVADSCGRVRTWLRRLFTHPTTGQLVAMDSRGRTVPPGLADFIAARDQGCRTPWCDAPVRHYDHILPHAQGGATDAGNIQGYCEACNYTKQAPGWTTRTIDPGGSDARAGPATDTAGHLVRTTTPTGHHYWSRAPALPGPQAEAGSHQAEDGSSPLERAFARYVAA